MSNPVTKKPSLKILFAQKLEQLFSMSYLPKARHVLVMSLLILMTLSLLMIASASIPFAQKYNLPELKFFWSQLSYIGIGLVAGFIVYHIPLKWYYQFPLIFSAWFFVQLLLVLTLFSDKINGSRRWLDFGVMNLQTAELAKILMVIIIADYVVRRSAEVREHIFYGWRLLLWYLPVSLLIVMQPDLGTVLVILATAFIVLFVSGTPYSHSLVLTGIGAVASYFAIRVAEYRAKRLMSFLDPYNDVQDTDFQPARALAAFSRGGFDGVGYGDSILKLSHLPEAHTDYLLAITGEELGFIGVASVLLLEILIIACIMRISYQALKRNQLRLSYTTFGFATVIFGQVFINAGMNMSLLPSKGLTLPFYSFGGSSMLVMMMMIAIVLKVDAQSAQIDKDNQNRKY